MFNYIKGELIEKREGCAVVECGGIGYEIFISNYTLATLPAENIKTTLFTYLHVKEDGLTLFGFATKQEKEVFLKLITVGGIGPKTASAILSNITPNELITAVMTQNLVLLSSVKGVGKKTAERILLELRSKIDAVAGGIDLNTVNMKLPDSVAEHAMKVLTDWGVPRQESYKLVMANYSQNDTLETLIAKTLKSMDGRR